MTARGQATRAKLLTAACDVFVERGFAATRMGDVASAAGVAHGTVYTYFDTKQDVLLGVLRAVSRDMRAAMAPLRVSDAIPRVQAMIHRYLTAYRANASILRVAGEAAAADERIAGLLVELRRAHVARVAATIAAFQADGLAAPDLDPQTAAVALCEMLDGVGAHWLGGEEVPDEEFATRTLTQLWVRGLGIHARVAARGQRVPSTRSAVPRAPTKRGRG